jgi:hypothetical protein
MQLRELHILCFRTQAMATSFGNCFETSVSIKPLFLHQYIDYMLIKGNLLLRFSGIHYLFI